MYVALATESPGCGLCDLYLLEICLPPAAAEQWATDVAMAMEERALGPVR